MKSQDQKFNFDGPCTKKELAEILNVSERTLYRILKKSNIETGPSMLTPRMVKEIIEKLGWNQG